MSRPLDLSTVLDGYGSGALNHIRQRWLGKGSPADKLTRLRELTQVLSDEVRVTGALGRLDADERLVLTVAERLSGATLGSLRAALTSEGLRAPEGPIESVLRWGLLLSLPYVGARVLEFNELWHVTERRLVVLPMAVGRVLPTPPRLERLPTVAPSAIQTVYAPDPGRLVRAALALAAIAERRKIKLTVGDWISATHLPVLERELGLDPKLPLPLVIEVARCAGLVVSVQGLLRAGPASVLTAATPLGERVSALWTGFLERGRWWDDLPDMESTALQAALREPPWGAYPLNAAAEGRRTTVGVLRRLRVEGWMSLDALAALVLDLEPGLLVRAPRSVWSGHDAQIPPVAPRMRAIQYNVPLAVLARTCFAFGLVELGTTTGSFPDLVRPTQDQRHWDRWQDPGLTRYREEDRKKPLWTPTSSGVVFRVTPLGQQVLWGRVAPAPAPAAPGLRVGPDFEIVAMLDETPPEAMYRLESLARADPGHAADRARRFRLEKDRWLAALKSGLDAAAVTAQLVAWSGRPLPDNVARTLQDWTDSFGLVTVHAGLDLLEFSSSAERDSALVAMHGEAVGDRYALVPQGSVSGTAIDYAAPPWRCLDVALNGDVAIVAAQADLLVEGEIAAFTEATKDGPTRRITAASVRACPWGADALLARLERRVRGGLPPGLALAIRGWRGEVAPLPLVPLTVLQVADPAIASALLSRPELAAHLAGVVAPGMLLVRAGQRAALVKALAALGIAVSDSLRVG